MSKLTRSLGSFGLGIACAALVLPNVAEAGGLARPNAVSTRGIGMGGAFSAIADDPTALHFNPAGIARLSKSHIMIGGEFIVAPRTYKPISDFCTATPDDAKCRDQSPTSPVRPLPSLGFTTRIKNQGVPSRLSFGVGVWNTFGGQLEYDECDTCGPGGTDNQIPGTLQETRNAVIEVVPGLAYEVNDVIAVGMAIRLGIGLFDTVAYQRPTNTELHATGIGAGATFGIMITPNKKLSIGAYYRTALTVDTTGDGENETVGPVEVTFEQRWPQQMGAGIAYRPTPKLLVAGQFDWHGWSRLEQISPVIVGRPGLTENARIPLDWNNSYSVHAGLQYELTSKIAARGGFTYDTRAIAERSQERQFLDSNKMLMAFGGSFQFTKSWRVDTAFETSVPGGKAGLIDDNSMAVSSAGGWAEQLNQAPGEHSGKLYTFEIAFQYMY